MANNNDNPRFYTDHGEVHCVTEKGRKRFVFFNPKSTKNEETVAFIKTFTALANYLPEAQSAASKFLKLKESLPNESAQNPDEDAGKKRKREASVVDPDGETPSTVSDETAPPRAKKRYLQQAPCVVDETRDDDTLYSKILYVYGKEPMIRVMLVVNLFEGNPYIWLKRFWFTESDSLTSEPAWLPCFGSYRFSLSDDSKELLRFAQKCMLEEEEERRKIMADRLKNRITYHDAAKPPPPPLKQPEVVELEKEVEEVEEVDEEEEEEGKDEEEGEDDEAPMQATQSLI